MTRHIPSTPSASTLNGFWFVFHHGGHAFAFWISSFTGKEEVYLDGVLVAERRNVSLKSTHELVVGEVTYLLELRTRNLRRGVFECVLYETGIPVAALETECVVHRKWEQSALMIIGLAIVLFAAWKADASFWVGMGGILVVSACTYALLGRRSGYVIRPAQSSVLPKE